MEITSLKLANIRSIETAEFRFQPGFNLIAGVNGVGEKHRFGCITFLSISDPHLDDPVSCQAAIL